METKPNWNEIYNYEVKIYAETANEIFKRCLSAANIEESRGWAKMLATALSENTKNNQLDSNYLRNTYNKIKKEIAADRGMEKMTFYHINIQTLSRFAGLEDYLAFDSSIKPFNIPVMYVFKPFKFYNLIRIANKGKIIQQGDSWILATEEQAKVTGTITSVSPYTMSGDKNDCWLKVTYQYAHAELQLYLTELGEQGHPLVLSKSRLPSFFENSLRQSKAVTPQQKQR